jgi:class 3 adenylate cyclase
MERKVATVLFADLVDSTKLGEQDPERTRLLLDRFYSAMSEEVALAGGTLEKFAGDAVMAAFGAPAALEDHAERALHAALAMRRRLDEIFGGALELRIGVNTGEVVVDTDAHSSFVTGDAVNVCARLEQHAAPGEILVGERTAAAARGAFEFSEPRRIEAKGKAEPVECRALVRAMAARRPRGRFARPFVGRTRELGTLLDTYARAVASGEPQLALIVGDAGVGKSRLVRELWDALAAQPEGPVLRVGRCLSYGSAITYWPVREIVQAHLGLSEDADPAEVTRRLGDRSILGVALGLDVAGDLHPLAARDRLRDAWVDLLDEAVAESPIVLVIEDVHSAEAPLLELLERTVRDVRGPLLVVATARPDAEWTGGRRNVTTLELEPLAREAAQQLVGDLPASLHEFLLDRAEGNPFFVEELTESLVDRGVLAERDGRWEALDVPDALGTPDSVRGVLEARIDLLPAPEKAALQAAAVIGRAFWEGPVRELIGGDADFALLEERDFIRRSPETRIEGEREHTIKHALTREAAYAGIPKAHRARLHAAFAEWIERREGADELASLLAHHYAEAVRAQDADLAWAGAEDEYARLQRRAVAWLRRAGTLAVRRYEIEDGIALLERALKFEDDVAVRTDLWREIGYANAIRFAGDAFVQAMQNSLEVCVDRAACADTYSVLAFQTSIRSGMWQERPDDAVVEEWIDRALELAAPDSPAYARALIARANWSREAGLEASREGSALAEQLGDPELRSYAWAACATVDFDNGAFEDAANWALRRFELEPEISDPDHLVELRETAAPAVAALGRLREARRLAVEHVSWRER